jgi:isochorismate hydrolase
MKIILAVYWITLRIERSHPPMHPRLAQRDDAFLLILDMQTPLLNVMNAPERLLANCKILIEGVRTLGIPIFATEQYPDRFGATTDDVRSRWGEVVPAGKMVFSGCRCAELMRQIEATGRNTAIVCGVETHVCVNQTALDFMANGYTVHVPADAVDSRTDLNWRLGLEKMRDAGAVMTSTEMVLFELMEKAGTPEFKALLPLFR